MNIRRVHTSSTRHIDREDIDAVVHIRSRRRCQFERAGMDPASIAVHLLAETGDVPGWDTGLDDDGGEDWAA
ncbi:hypothetical protein [Nocardia transvalensis]|uniref:hypothetical protein n=1 Tax=Nocardia transvalensis TaxID=37333 RepID=UPI001893AAE3|nr:hypothetical protein [Nocardia transvalensis]MBF6334239.1 hypothetical protein [Nocardia transvalensis]